MNKLVLALATVAALGLSTAAFAENPAVFILDAGAAAGSAPINAKIRDTFPSH